MGEVGSDHSFTGETLLKYFPHATALNKTEILNRLYSFNLVFDDEARDTVLDDLRYGTARVSDDSSRGRTAPANRWEITGQLHCAAIRLCSARPILP
jgi:hypothetical protein